MQEKEPRNPFYMLLLIASLVFVANALAVAFVPVLEQKAREAGQIPPAADLRNSLRGSTGLTWLLYELAAMGLFALLSMGLDRYRSLKKQRDLVSAKVNDHSRANAECRMPNAE